MTRVLLLGGTTEATALASMMADRGIDAVFSYAGRTADPTRQLLPTRIGGFGGPEGLVAYLRHERISHVVDATHPFAAQMSRNAVIACDQTATPLLALERPPWLCEAGDNWWNVVDIQAAVAVLPETPTHIFLAIGRQNLQAFSEKPQHHYLLRVVDPLTTGAAQTLALPRATIIVDKGPFTQAKDCSLLLVHGITHVVAKNAGGSGASAKLAAARSLRLPVIMIDRPNLPDRQMVHTVQGAINWLSHPANLGV